METFGHYCPKCNARGSWLQNIGWDNVNKCWERGCVLCGWRPRQRPPQNLAQADDALRDRGYAKGA